jgi:hypothetical protein
VPVGRVLRVTILLLAVLMPCAGRTAAQGVSTPALKAAFLLNFVKFTEWPNDALPAGAPLSLCVLGDNDVAKSLEELILGQSVGAHGLNMNRMSAGGAIRACHLIYISRVGAKESIAIVQSLQNTPTLTVSDRSGFAQSGGILNFIVENDRMRFVINVEAAHRAGLRLSSKLLSLAEIVKNQSNLSVP